MKKKHADELKHMTKNPIDRLNSMTDEQLQTFLERLAEVPT